MILRRDFVVGAASGNFEICELQRRPDFLDKVAAWHYRECLRQGLQTTLEKRKSRLAQHLKYDPKIPQTWLAINENILVGCISLVSYHLQSAANSSSQSEPLWLSNLFVEPEYRRRGVGSELMNTVISYSRELGERELWLIASDQTDYYRSRGWHTVRQVRIAKQPANVMRVSLL
ncbi:GNAT family N-acetyltransferase [Gilvimarinus sp. SDUM040013]|uniref:GNAT family N-acetyltransferase n=1 Tax=Gilvimarinus gilvus TaxID=3058038 RepID=A0ABU4RYE2_9GAMM|nr:GNAT family N-acetyltransferase [Gilvimarinus sp. SDUM040013]MDO3385278.1 GNAT family N-acetyltransferase [Gilvimarinus sp. SDUM040013]MDX6849261.1 GNAT family N-acetyltransferase [Gilvimarinus sp. SDUM040013]